jgi:hypothetical protein
VAAGLERRGPPRRDHAALRRHQRFNEHLGPLRRFLGSRVGRPWDKVFAEICANIDRGSAVQDHVRDHVDDFVETRVLLIDGVPCHGSGRLYGQPLADGWRGWRQFYVCPRTGLLKRLPPRAREERREVEPARYVRLDATHQCRWMDGAWYLVTLQPIPPPPLGVPAWGASRSYPDAVLGRELSRGQAVEAYGIAAYGVARRRLGKRELRQLPVPIDWQK